MSHAFENLVAATAGAAAQERRANDRALIQGDLWLIDVETRSVVRARCVDASDSGMRLRVPVGYGVHAGKRYELSSHLPWMNAGPGLGLRCRRSATVRRAQLAPGADSGQWDVGVSFDAPDRAEFVAAPVAGWV